MGVVDVNMALKFVQQAVRDSAHPDQYDVLVLAGRVTEKISHTRVIEVDIPEDLSDAQGSRYLKTAPHKFIPDMRGTYCYLDNDAFVLSASALKIFDLKKGIVQFASDQFVTVRKFTHPSLHYGNLPDALNHYFKVRVDADWRIWNSGVYLFDSDSRDFLDAWHAFMLQTFDIPQWKVKDQAPLIAAVWKFGLENADRIPSVYNWLYGMSERGKHKTVFAKDGPRSAGLYYKKNKIRIVHFIGGDRNKGAKEWLSCFELVLNPSSAEFKKIKKYQNALKRSGRRIFNSLKSRSEMLVLRPLWHVSAIFREFVPGYAARLDSLKQRHAEKRLEKLKAETWYT